MTYLKIEAEYIARNDMADMLKMLAEEILKDTETVLFEIESNFGGKLVAKFSKEELEDLRIKNLKKNE